METMRFSGEAWPAHPDNLRFNQRRDGGTVVVLGIEARRGKQGAFLRRLGGSAVTGRMRWWAERGVLSDWTEVSVFGAWIPPMAPGPANGDHNRPRLAIRAETLPPKPPPPDDPTWLDEWAFGVEIEVHGFAGGDPA